MAIPGAASVGFSLGDNDLVLDEKGLEEDPIECRYGEGDEHGDGDFGLNDVKALLLCSTDTDGLYVRPALANADAEDEEA